MNRRVEAAALIVGAVVVLGWFGYRQFQAWLPDTAMPHPDKVVVASPEMSPLPSASPVSQEQRALSSSNDLSVIEDDVNATVIYDENLADLK